MSLLPYLSGAADVFSILIIVMIVSVSSRKGFLQKLQVDAYEDVLCLLRSVAQATVNNQVHRHVTVNCHTVDQCNSPGKNWTT